MKSNISLIKVDSCLDTPVEGRAGDPPGGHSRLGFGSSRDYGAAGLLGLRCDVFSNLMTRVFWKNHYLLLVRREDASRLLLARFTGGVVVEVEEWEGGGMETRKSLSGVGKSLRSQDASVSRDRLRAWLCRYLLVTWDVAVMQRHLLIAGSKYPTAGDMAV
ncbi:hypothetical protein PoB_006519800 [Plakobranchus ocellatus]|uniref:Uncharacterized protein n=1 Tax=Plakobranchus ocellatus TaxID=259542 RepID=A0AAV4D3T2_9GAST|nr:hypothetical protein PoB_006519800 [Plakobranchus ocellatus]